MIGLFIIHPRAPYQPRVDRDFGLILQEWAILPNNTVPNTLAMEFNWLTINGKAGPGHDPDDREAGRAGADPDGQPRDGPPSDSPARRPVRTSPAPRPAASRDAPRCPRTRVLVGVAQARDVEFEAKHPGRLDAALPSAAPHDEPDGVDGRAADAVARERRRASDMEAGFGIANGWALADTRGPALGRTVGVGAEPERAVSNRSMEQASSAPGQHAGHQMPAGPNRRRCRAIRRTCTW